MERIVAAENIADGDRRRNYQIDWKTLFATVRRVRQELCEMIGFYHSHLDGSAEPSRKDAELAWLDHSYVILLLVDLEVLSVTSWRIPNEGASSFEPEAIILT